MVSNLGVALDSLINNNNINTGDFSISSERNYVIDILRIIAIFAVIMLHSFMKLVADFDYHTTNYLVGNLFNSISRFAVPFFVMISGFLMLNEKKEIKCNKLKYKVIKLFIILLFWSAFYSLIYSFDNFIPSFFYGGHYHLWFLYLIIGLYLLTPILRLFVKKENKNLIYYLMLILFIFNFLPTFLDSIFPPDVTSKYFNQYCLCGFGYLLYYLIGWGIFINISKIKINYSILTIAILVSIATIFSGSQFVHYHKYKSYDIFYNPLNIPVLLYSVSLFLFLYKFFEKRINKLSLGKKKIITKFSNLTFGVYLIHESTLHLFESILIYIPNDKIYIITLFVLTSIFSFLITFILYKIKYIKELIKI